MAPPGAVVQPCSKRRSAGLVGLAPASHSCNLRVCACVSLARPVCKRAREGDEGRQASRQGGEEEEGLQLLHVGQQCWQERRPGAAGSRSPACARGWRFAGAPLPEGAIVGLAGAELRIRTCSIQLAERRSQRRGASRPRRPRPRFPGGGSLQPR